MKSLRKSLERKNAKTLPSKFGYLLTGKQQRPMDVSERTLGVSDTSVAMVQEIANFEAVFEDDRDRRDKQWTTDSGGICEFTGTKDAEKEANNAKVAGFFEDTVHRRNGVYYRLPFKENHTQLPDNRAIANKRLVDILYRLELDPNFLQAHDRTIRDQFEKEITGQVTDGQPILGETIAALMVKKAMPHQGEDVREPLLNLTKTWSFISTGRAAAIMLIFIGRSMHGLNEDRQAEIFERVKKLRDVQNCPVSILGEIMQPAQMITQDHQKRRLSTKYKSMDNTLHLFQDSHSIWRLRVQLGKISLSDQKQNPIYIAPKTPPALLMIKEVHSFYHRLVEYTMMAVRIRREAEEAIQSCRITEQFWKVWQHHYLTSLREKPPKKISRKRLGQETLIVGSIVLISNPVLPRNSWKLARITDIRRGTDGVIREAKLVTSNRRKVRRPVNLLIRLEIIDDMSDISDKESTSSLNGISKEERSEKSYNLRSRQMSCNVENVDDHKKKKSAQLKNKMSQCFVYVCFTHCPFWVMIILIVTSPPIKQLLDAGVLDTTVWTAEQDNRHTTEPPL
ncbi:unnamed protein product [Cylicocyclus nassatus]|uniref:DUF5641 domain-containing protein n=1 Tax=Cylicocyclus nassatus TaxID=53992 RepID=A0AA36DN36_CYLNA|nr:unnamed protein product [Cylicocyclus nassatus]